MDDPALTPTPAAIAALARFLRGLGDRPPAPRQAVVTAAGSGKTWSAFLRIAPLEQRHDA